MTPDISRKPPGSEESDLAVISCMMQSPDHAIPIASEILKATDFSTFHCSVLFDLIIQRHYANHPVDAAGLFIALSDSPDKLSAVGGPAKLTEAYVATSLPSAVRSYCETVKDASIQRTVARLADRLTTIAYEKPEDWRTQTVQTISAIDASMTTMDTARTVSYRDVILDYLDRCVDDCDGEIDPPVTTGIKAMDEIMDGGIRRGFYLIGGKQGSGKSLLAQQFAGHLANAGRRGLMVGLEMLPIENAMRDIAREASVALNVINGRNRDRSDWDLRDIRTACTRMAQDWDVHFTTDANMSVDSIVAHARALHRVKPIDFIVVDYAQLIARAGNAKERTDEILKAIAERLRELKIQLKCTIILPTQLNDEGEVRDSRALQDAPETVIKIIEDQRDNDADPDDPYLGFIRITKNRWGANNVACRVERVGKHQKFVDSSEPAKTAKKDAGPFSQKKKWS